MEEKNGISISNEDLKELNSAIDKVMEERDSFQNVEWDFIEKVGLFFLLFLLKYTFFIIFITSHIFILL